MTSEEVEGDDPLAMLDAYDFELPPASIAHSPARERDSARLLVLDRSTGRILASDPDHRVRNLPSWLRSGDLLVRNATRVRSARLVGEKSTGGMAEALLLGPTDAPNRSKASGSGAGLHYRVLLKCTGRPRVGLSLSFGPNLELAASVVELHERGEATLCFESEVDPHAFGNAPLPPYIQRSNRDSDDEDLERYQTIYAREPGAIAAPTAGLHFSEDLFHDLRESGVGVAEVVLHVGAGTFRPLDAKSLSTGRLHEEDFVLPKATVEAIEKTRACRGRVIAIGTTTARVLESQVQDNGRLRAGTGKTELFIRPGGPPFRIVDGLITNFHLPRSSLLLLVAEFAGRRRLLDAYDHAIAEGFRFYSYGDAMLILDAEGKKLDEGEAR
jgi:S-adenosylmethionine:tRNA ribosyltransferase-isomerase